MTPVLSKCFGDNKYHAVTNRPAKLRLVGPPRGLSLEISDEKVKLPPMDRNTRIATAYAATGVSLEGYLTSLRRDAFTRAGARSIKDMPRLRPGQAITIGGILTVGQCPPTAKGFSFLTVEDSDGFVEVVVRPDVHERCRDTLRGPFVIVEGTLQRIRGAINVRAKNVTRV